MAEKAIDIVLLPAEEMRGQAIAANRWLVDNFGSEIVLSEEGDRPHVSLAMGVMDENQAGQISEILEKIARKNPVKKLKATGIVIEENSKGQKISAVEIERTAALQKLHEDVMREAGGYLGYEVTSDMVLGENVLETTLNWIRNYRNESSFDKFWPHITIGYGQVMNFEFTGQFEVDKLALCRLGNNCTCREVLWGIELYFGRGLTKI
ncbi:MAG: hypothetical protein ACYSSI_09145 [Planctomycetota bacterium]|jgi:2'-5' RNA ligase